MKKGVVRKGFYFLALAILISSPFVFAGFGDWWASFTGRATYNDTDVSVTLGNTGPVIFFVSQPTGLNPNEGQSINYYVWFNASDADGAANLDDATAYLNFTRAGGGTRENSSCVLIQTYSAVNTKTYNCTITMQWFDESAPWTIYAVVDDINSVTATNNSISVTPAGLHAWTTNFTGTFTFPGIGGTSTDIQSNNDPLHANNTGNTAITVFNVTGSDLQGETTTSEYIYAENFTFHTTATCTGGTTVQDGTGTDITGTSLARGNNAHEAIFLCLQGVPQGISAQDYSTTGTTAWRIASETA